MSTDVPDPSRRAVRPAAPVVRNETRGNPFAAEGPPVLASRFVMAVFAVPFGLIAAWMAWILTEYLHGDGWVEVIARCVLGEFILAVGLFALVLLAVALAPPRLSDSLQAAGRKVVHRITLMTALFGATLTVLFGTAVLTSLLILTVVAWRQIFP
jgi:hypothetical protein